MLSSCIIRGQLRNVILYKGNGVYTFVMPTSCSLHRMQLDNVSPYAVNKQLNHRGRTVFSKIPFKT